MCLATGRMRRSHKLAPEVAPKLTACVWRRDSRSSLVLVTVRGQLKKKCMRVTATKMAVKERGEQRRLMTDSWRILKDDSSDKWLLKIKEELKVLQNEKTPPCYLHVVRRSFKWVYWEEHRCKGPAPHSSCTNTLSDIFSWMYSWILI